MKKGFTLLAAVFAAFLALNAQQVPNAGFETWSVAYKPDSWATVDGLFGTALGFTTKDTADKVEGTASIKLVNDSLAAVPQAGVVPGLVSLGTATYAGGQPSFKGVPFAFRPDTLRFSYKYSSPGNDTAGLEMSFQKSGSAALLEGGLQLAPTNGQWADVYVVLTSYYTAAGTPDTLILQFLASYKDAGPAIKGSTLNVDNVRFGYVAAPSAINNVAEIELTVFPNPATDVLNVSSTENLAGYTFEVMDVTGRVLNSTILTGTVSTVNVAELAKGNYIYKITNKNNQAVKYNQFSVVK